MNWKLTSEELPQCELPVWLYDADKKLGPYIGCRTDDQDADGWLWARCYDGHYWDSTNERWIADTAEEDDDHPTHWMPLPYPPNADLSHAAPPAASTAATGTTGRRCAPRNG